MTATRVLLVSLIGTATTVASAFGGMIDLTKKGDTSLYTIAADVGGEGLVGTARTQPAGTGVFDPFLTIQSPGSTSVERGYNTVGAPLYLDQTRPHWNQGLKLGDLAVINVAGKGDYFVFELDANEPGNQKSLISIDNIRIYTSSEDNTWRVQNDETKLGLLGELVWAMNDPLKVPANPPADSGKKNPKPAPAPQDLYNIDTWIKLDANQDQGNGGSGISDMNLYVPVSAFANASPTDFVWFYNLNGVHYTADGNLGAQAGFEEWRARVKTSTPPPPDPVPCPDGGATLLLLGLSTAGMALLNNKLRFQS